MAPRCKECINCLELAAALLTKTNKKQKEKFRKLWANKLPCAAKATDPNKPPLKKKPRILELEALGFNSRGGRFYTKEPDSAFASSNEPFQALRKRPNEGLMTLPTYDQDAFSKYESIVRKCVTVGIETKCQQIRDEYDKVISKLQAPLGLDVRDEFVYKEEAKNAKRIYILWGADVPVGNKILRECDELIDETTYDYM